MRTTDDILKDLETRAANGEDVRQQVNSHRALVRLRDDLGRAEKGSDPQLIQAIRSQIRVHLGHVEEDVDSRIVEQPSKDSTKRVLTDDPTKV